MSELMPDPSEIQGREQAFSTVPEHQQEKGVLLFDGKKYAVELFWLVAEEGQNSLAKDRAKKANSDFYCIRSSILTQHGFGKLSLGHRMGMPSAAAFAVDMLVGEWHAIFKADNGWWYLAVHGDAIAPNGDRFFFDEEEAYNFFKEEMDKYKWPRSYAPNEWGIEGITSELPLDRVFDQAVPTALKPVTLDAVFAGSRNKTLFISGFFVVLSLIVMISFLPNLILSRLQEPPPIISLAELNMGEIKVPPNPSEARDAIEGVKLKLPKPSVVIASCGQGIAKIVRPLPGWSITEAVCDGRSVNVVWNQQGGTVDLLMENAGIFPKGATARLEGNRFLAGIYLERVPREEKEIKLMNRVDAVLLMNNRLSGAGALNVKFVQPPAPRPKEGINIRKADPPPPPPPYLDIKFETHASPQNIATYFDVDGLEIKSVKWLFGSGEWQYDAKINLKP